MTPINSNKSINSNSNLNLNNNINNPSGYIVKNLLGINNTNLQINEINELLEKINLVIKIKN